MERTKINMGQLEIEARAKAKNQIMNMFQRPGQLEKVEQLKHTYARKKASVEAKIKSAMQSQLDGVRVGLEQLNTSLEMTKDIEQNLKSMNNLFANLPNLMEKFSEVREENMRHSQYVTARENLKHIFTVPESVEKTKNWINEGKLLHAHQCLRDLENSRDELLLELHKLPNQSNLDTGMLKAYFADVEILSQLMEKQIRLILSRTLNTVRKDPTVIVTALRIIEREEKADKEASYHKSGFKPPGRPKCWKDLAFEVLEKTVDQRIQGTQVEEREDNKLWLVRYLELTRQVILEDLRVVKTLCVPCFPPRYNIVNQYVNWYHKALSSHLKEIIQNGVEGNEYVSILSWTLNIYKGVELMGHPDLKEYTTHLGMLLPNDIINELQDHYLKIMDKNYIEWMQNTLKKEREEWRSNNQPSSERYLRTAAPVIIFQMIDQNLEVTKTISQEMTNKALILSLEQVIKYADGYREAIIEFKNKHFEDRSQIIYFTQYMISIVNNCHQLTELGSQFEKMYCVPGSLSSLSECFKRLHDTYINLRNEAGGYLLEEVFLDLDKHFEELFTVKWLTMTLPVDTICATLEDYFQDYSRLVEPNFRFVINEARNLITKKYLTVMLSKKITFKTLLECQTAADTILKEIKHLQKVFLNVEPNITEDDDCLEIIILLTEVLKCEDDMISFDLHRIVEKFPDINEDHLLRLLYLRGDLPKSDLKEKVSYVVKNSKPGTLTSKHNIFKLLVFPKLVNLSF